MTNIQTEIIRILIQYSDLQSSQIHKHLTESGISLSLITAKREVKALLQAEFIEKRGSGRYVKYSISIKGKVFATIDSQKYTSIDPDLRYGQSKYNFELFEGFPTVVITEQELAKLEEATNNFYVKSKNISPIIEKKELERLVIELSWKSSKIEGNTYTLLDTERLILENVEANGHTKDETQMILNHKKAFDYIWEHRKAFKSVSKAVVETVHSLLTDNLEIRKGYRKTGVGVNGSIYKPLDNTYQIEDAMDSLFGLIGKANNPYDKALMALAGISYIQPFEDGNKRTSRLVANSILIGHDLAPLSYRSVDIDHYRSAMLTFYELNSSMPLKGIFINQYIESANNYLLRSVIPRAIAQGCKPTPKGARSVAI